MLVLRLDQCGCSMRRIWSPRKASGRLLGMLGMRTSRELSPGRHRRLEPPHHPGAERGRDAEDAAVSDLEKAMAEMLAHIEAMHLTREGSVRCGLGDAATICDLLRKQIEASHRGRTRGSVSKEGQIAAAAIQLCADTIWTQYQRVKVTAP